MPEYVVDSLCPILNSCGKPEGARVEGIVGLFIAPAIALGQRVADTAAGRGFHDALDDFTQLLRTVPDSPTDAMDAEDLAALRAIAQTVIEHIERRIEARTDRLAEEVTLAQNVYGIQQALENIDRWHRHLAAVPLPPAGS